jgi:DNA mismatch repair protein MutS
MGSFAPKEVLYAPGAESLLDEVADNVNSRFKMDDWVFTLDAAMARLSKQFEVQNLKGFGIDGMNEAIVAAGSILYYLDQTCHFQTAHISRISRVAEHNFVWLDKFTIRNLELFGSNYGDGKSFVDILDHTQTPMGARLLRRWVAFPLKNVADIVARQEIVEAFFRQPELKEELLRQLPLIGDMERLESKVSAGRINPREVVQLKTALFAIEQIKALCTSSMCDALHGMADSLQLCTEVRNQIDAWIEMDPPMAVNRGGVIKAGVDAELDEYRSLAYSGKDYLLKMQQREAERTGISSLKISYNNVFGYYIEVRNSHKEAVPETWIRKQTLVNAERYITPELKEYEEKILGAEERILIIENRLFQELLQQLLLVTQALQANAEVVARLDVLSNFSVIAALYRYNRPVITDTDVLDIKGGRHPVIEQQMPVGQPYIPNDVYLDSASQQIIIITGPNMAGKSALLRQTALITLMAQMGSFVPADSAHIGVVDKIFTRVGAGDNISMGESTFMVEMNEASSILNNLSHRSLVLFDELGRGTSTYDGISLAWAIVEYIHEHSSNKARTLFATHYHELNEMEKSFARIKNYHITVKEMDGKVIFLRKLAPGGSEHSFGIHVAKLAGMPKSVLQRADQVLASLEQQNSRDTLSKPLEGLAQTREGYQLSLFQLDDPVLASIRDEIKNVDINNLTPIEALNKLNEIKKIITGKS